MLDNYVLFDEVVEIMQVNKDELYNQYQDDIIEIQNVLYIKKDLFKYSIRSNTTDLYEYIPLLSFVERIGMEYLDYIIKMIVVMEKDNVIFFHYKEFRNKYYIYTDEKLKYLLNNFKVRVIKSPDDYDFRHMYIFGIYRLAFY